MSTKDIANDITNAGLAINKSQVVLNKSLKTLSYEDIKISLHPEVHLNFKLNIARSDEEAKEQSKSGKAIITTETTGGDIRSTRAQKDAKRFEKKENKIEDDKNDKSIALEKSKVSSVKFPEYFTSVIGLTICPSRSNVSSHSYK